jgi:hypothetical protein
MRQIGLNQTRQHVIAKNFSLKPAQSRANANTMD